MKNKDLDSLAKECGLGSIYERPIPTEVSGKIKWVSSGEITPFGHSLIQFAKECDSLTSKTEAEVIEEILRHLIPRVIESGKIATLIYAPYKCTYDPITKDAVITKEGL